MHLLSTGVVAGQRHSRATLWEWGPGSGGYDLEIPTQSRFLNNAPNHQVSSSYV